MRVVPLALRRDPLEVLASLAAEPGAFLLEVPDRAQPLTLLGCAPRARLRILADGCIERDGRLAGGDPLAALERFVAEGPSLPFPYGSAVGYLAYELGRCTEPGRDGGPPAPDGPLAVLSRYDPARAPRRGRGGGGGADGAVVGGRGECVRDGGGGAGGGGGSGERGAGLGGVGGARPRGEGRAALERRDRAVVRALPRLKSLTA